MVDLETLPRPIRKRIRSYERSIEEDPGNLVLRLKLAFALREAGQVGEAITVYCAVAAAYVERGREVQAAAICRGILALDPEQGEVQALLRRIEERTSVPRAPSPEEPDNAIKRSMSASGGLSDLLLSTLPPVSFHAVTRATVDLREPRRPDEGSGGEATEEAAGEETDARTPVWTFRGLLSDPGSGLRDGSPLLPPADSRAPRLEDDPALDPTIGLVASATPVPLFCALPRDALIDLIHAIDVCRVAKGEVIVREGEPGDACFVVASGTVRVTKESAAGEVELAQLDAGAVFGEFALLADRRRHATVTASNDVELLVITRRVLGLLLDRHPEAGTALRRFYRERLLANLVATGPFFRSLQPSERDALAHRFRFRRFPPGVRILVEGEAGGGLYLILLGRVAILSRDDGAPESEPRRIATLGEGSYFGEMSLLRGQPACASVVTEEACECVQLPPRDFYAVLAEHPTLWEDLRGEAERRTLFNARLLAGSTAAT